MNNYLHNHYLETKVKFNKFSSRLQKSQERGEFHRLSKGKQNFLLSRVKRLWEKLRILEVQLKITTVGASMALMLMVSNVSGQNIVAAPEKNPLPSSTISGDSPYLIDFDSDGDLDMLTTAGYYSINLFENTGTPENAVFEKVSEQDNPFSELSSYGIGLQTYDIIDVDDIDGDGDMDILSDDGFIIRNIGTNEVPEFVGEAFDGYLPGGTQLVDIDNDGDLDLVAVSSYYYQYGYGTVNGGSISYYENIGDATTFALNQSISETQIPIANWDESIDWITYVNALDLDGDGDTDFVIGVESFGYDQYYNFTYTYDALIIRNTGTNLEPVFELEDDVNNPYRDIENIDVQFGDLDNDGDFDVIMSSRNNLTYYEVDATALTENKAFIPEFYDGISLPASYFYPPHFVDYDGDGDMDLFTLNFDTYSIDYYEYIETEAQLKYAVNKEKPLPFFEEELGLQLPFFVDLDGDGDMDVYRVSYDYEAEALVYKFFENIGSNANPSYTEHTVSGPLATDDFRPPSFVDIDNDGDADMFMLGQERIGGEYGYWVTKIKYFENTGDDAWVFTDESDSNNPLEILESESFFGLEYSRLVFSDVDADGDYDVVASNYYGSIYYLQNTGTPEGANFTDRSESGAFSQISAGYYGIVNMVDIDGDGDDDLFTHSLYGASTSFYENLDPGDGASVKPEFNSQLDAYPNPATSELNIRMTDDYTGQMDYAVVSLEGKMMQNGSIEKSDSFLEFKLDTESLASGYYILRITSPEQVYVSKFVKK